MWYPVLIVVTLLGAEGQETKVPFPEMEVSGVETEARCKQLATWAAAKTMVDAKYAPNSIEVTCERRDAA